MPCASLLSRLVLALLVGSVYVLSVTAFDLSLYDNVAVYWGQDSYAAANPGTTDLQQPISFYCQDDAIDVIPIAFVDTFFGTGGYPVLNLANTCNSTNNTYYSGTELLNCSFLASDIEYCQNQGKAVTISLGGSGGSVGLSSAAEAEAFADTIWDLFLGGSNDSRPFGSAVLDGVDLDIEGGSDEYYANFVTQLRTYFDGADKTYYVSGAPQCEYPDEYLGAALNSAYFDMVYVQFYNNPCGLQNFDDASGWDFGLWDIWARNVSINPDVKVFVGAPASSTAAGTGYQDIGTLSSIAITTRNSFPSFGGVMLWDASQAYENDRYDLAIKDALVSAGATGFTYPACDAEEWTSGSSYSGGTNVSWNGYIWEAKYYASDEPTANYNGDWMPKSACSGAAAGGGSSSSISSTATATSASSTATSAPSTATSASSTATSASSTATSSSGNCAGIAAWSSSTAYTGGSEVQYNGDLWTAQYWTEDDVPGGSSGVWTDDGPCTSSDVAAREVPPPTPAPVAPRSNSRFFRF